MAQKISGKSDSKLFSFPFTRLFIEPNRSIDHPKLFSGFTRNLSKFEKQKIIANYYQPYRNKVFEVIKKNASDDIPTIHISVHTFTPVLEGIERNFEIGLLYDPKRKSEKDFCRFWKSQLKDLFPGYRIRMNRPYKGASDGFTTFLRGKFDDKLYMGIELEINQKLYSDSNNHWSQICLKVGECLPALSNFSTRQLGALRFD